MKADPTAQLRLLELQALDARADHLRHRRAGLPEHAEIEQVTARHKALVGQAADQRMIVDDLTAAQAKADADVEQVKVRRERDRTRIDQGLISNPKDIERMQHELETLERRIATLEDEELEVMQQLEDAQTGLDKTVTEATEAEQRLDELVAARDAELAKIDQQFEEIAAERAPLAAELPTDLLALYEKLRDSKGGVGASELRARQCGGCRLSLDAAEIQAFREATDDEVLRCEECQRILVRTAESGL